MESGYLAIIMIIIIIIITFFFIFLAPPAVMMAKSTLNCDIIAVDDEAGTTNLLGMMSRR